MNGLSADKLRLLLQPREKPQMTNKEKIGPEAEVEDFGASTAEISSTKVSSAPLALTTGGFRNNIVLATLQDSTRAAWKEVQVMYSYPSSHRVRTTLDGVPLKLVFN